MKKAKNKQFFLTIILLLFMIILSPVKADSVNEALERVDIEGANLNLKVGEKPSLNAKLTNYVDDIKLEETFMSLNRFSYISNGESKGDADGLIKDYIYFHIINLYIKEDSSIRFDNNTKFFMNGVQLEVSYIAPSGTLAVLDSEKNTITPEGYVASSELDENFKQKQIDDFQEKVLKMIREEKVTYAEEETKDAIDDALLNNKEINVEIEVSESMTKSQAYYYTGGHFSNIEKALEKGKNIGAYYFVDIIVFVDGDVIGYISTLDIPVSITIPYPNGLPKLKDGYEFVWGMLRYHDGEVESIDAKRTENGITFMNDKYSSFAAVYEIVKTETTDVNEEVNNPQTNDTVYVYIICTIVSLIGMIGLKHLYLER